MPGLNAITETLRAERLRRSMSRSELGRRSRVSRSTIGNWEDRKAPALLGLERWAHELGYAIELRKLAPP